MWLMSNLLYSWLSPRTHPLFPPPKCWDFRYIPPYSVWCGALDLTYDVVHARKASLWKQHNKTLSLLLVLGFLKVTSIILWFLLWQRLVFLGLVSGFNIFQETGMQLISCQYFLSLGKPTHEPIQTHYFVWGKGNIIHCKRIRECRGWYENHGYKMIFPIKLPWVIFFVQLFVVIYSTSSIF